MPEYSPEFNPIILTTELQPSSSSQLGLGNSTSIGPAELLNCTVTITVSDVRRGFFVDGKDQNRKHEAVVMVFEFEFGSQKRQSWNPLNRIGAVKTKISVDEDEMETPGGDGLGREEEQRLRIVARYPRIARSAASEKVVKKSIALALDPSTLGVSVGSLSLTRETESTETRTTSLSSYKDGDMCVIWKLEEEGGTERGVPDVFTCAILLQTDGLPFSLSVQFTAPVMGNLYRGQTKMPIESKHLWERKRRDGWESEWSDFDSDEFKNWVSRKARNSWAATSDYGTNDK